MVYVYFRKNSKFRIKCNLFLIIRDLGQENMWSTSFFAHSFQLFSFFWLEDWKNVFTNFYFWPKSLGWLYSMHVSASLSSPKGSDFEIFTHITYGFFFQTRFYHLRITYLPYTSAGNTYIPPMISRWSVIFIHHCELLCNIYEKRHVT
jgi:hypothetical protein